MKCGTDDEKKKKRKKRENVDIGPSVDDNELN